MILQLGGTNHASYNLLGDHLDTVNPLYVAVQGMVYVNKIGRLVRTININFNRVNDLKLF